MIDKDNLNRYNMQFLNDDFMINCFLCLSELFSGEVAVCFGLQSKAVPDHHTSTTMFDRWYDVVLMKCCVNFTGLRHFKRWTESDKIWTNLNGIDKTFRALSSFGDHQASVFFVVSSGFYFGTLSWMPFWSSLFFIFHFMNTDYN